MIKKRLIEHYGIKEFEDKLRTALIFMWWDEMKLMFFINFTMITAGYFVLWVSWGYLVYTALCILISLKFVHDRTVKLRSDCAKTDDEILTNMREILNKGDDRGENT